MGWRDDKRCKLAIQKVGVEVEKEKDMEGGKEYEGQPMVRRGRERELGEVGGGDEGGVRVGEGENSWHIWTFGLYYPYMILTTN